ncbi:MAG: hypothetical protein SVS15_00080 [Thermodesulfobacteriota bacterium]|nr:hypothetical protein [Thermodesulfobacteriota bacterium]
MERKKLIPIEARDQGLDKKTAKKVWTVWFVLCPVLAAGYAFCQLYPISRGAPNPGLTTLLTVGMLFAVLLFVHGLFSLYILPGTFIRPGQEKNQGRMLFRTTLEFAVPFGCLLFAAAGVSEVRHSTFVSLAERAKPLVQAIEYYEHRNGHPPQSLDKLVPDPFPSVPVTGIRAYPYYEYQVFDQTYADARFIWYDLGLRGGGEMADQKKYNAGDPDHAILIFVFKGETVVEVRTDRVPDDPGDFKFDRETWRMDNISKRLLMLRDLIASTEFTGKTMRTVEGVLGKPNGEFSLPCCPWELRVQCPTGILNWDIFFYRPGRDYPENAYGGPVKRIGDWAYVHE